MSDRVPRSDFPLAKRPRGVTLLAAALLLAGGLVVARPYQDKADPPKDGEGRKPSTLFVLVHVKNEIRKDRLEATFDVAARKTGGGDALIDIRAIPPELYRDLQGLSDKLESKPAAAAEGEAAVKQKRGDDVIEWELKVNKPGLVVSEIDLIYADKDGKDKPPVTLKRGIAGDPKAKFVATPTAGVYTLRLAADDKPTKFVAKGTGFKEGKPVAGVTASGDWPAVEQYYLVALRNFRGDHKELLRIIKTKDVPNKLDSVVEGQDLRFVFASAGFNIEQAGAFDGNVYIPFKTPLKEQNVKRVWMLFPLTEAKAKEEAAKLGGMKVRDIPKEIRKSKPLMFDAANPVTTLEPGEAKWIELPLEGAKNGFTRPLTLKNAEAWKKSHPNASRVVVYEFDDGTTQAALEILDERSKKGTYALDEPIKEWPAGIAGAVSAEKAKAAKEKGGKE